MRQCELIKESKLLKIKSKILSNLFHEKYGLKLEEFNNTTGTERVNIWDSSYSESVSFKALRISNNSLSETET